MNMLLTGSDNHEPTYKRYRAYQCRAYRSRPSRSRAYRYIEPIEVGPIDIEPIDAVPSALETLDREPTLLSRYIQSVACSKPIFNNYCAIMNMLLTGSDNHEPTYKRYRAYQCRAYRSRPSRSRAYRYIEPIEVGPIDIEPIDAVPMALEPLDREPIDAVPIALDPLDREPTLLSCSIQSVACSKPIFINYFAIMNMLLTGSDNHEPTYKRYRAYQCIAYQSRPSRSRAYREPIEVGPIDIEPIDAVPMALEPLDIEPIDAVPIALDPLEREPTLLSRSIQSVACSKPIFNNYCAIMNMLLTGSDYHEPTYKRYRAYQCRAYRYRPSRSRAYRYIEPIEVGPIDIEPIDAVPIALDPLRSRAYIIKSLHPECCLFKTNFHQLLCNNEYAINWE